MSEGKAEEGTFSTITTSTASLSGLAFALVKQDWRELGITKDDPLTAPTSDLEVLVERVTSLFVVRLAARSAEKGKFPDLSTASICRRILMKKLQWPEQVTDQVIAQCREFVKRMLSGYKDVPYHNKEHAYHVILSTNKMLDMMCLEKKSVSFGLKHDSLMLLAQLFAALVHDVEHQGIPNRQLAVENDRLAVLYNDQSIAENWSLYIAFSEFLQDDFQELRDCMFQKAHDEYIRFRKTVVNLVLTTDIASPERTQIFKSKWKEAFGDPYETVERKVLRRMSLTGKELQIRKRRVQRRGTGESALSELSEAYGRVGTARQHHQEDDDDSLSLTPENSDYEVETGISGGDGPVDLSSPLAGTHHNKKFERRMSASSRNTATSKYRVRLGILRTVDLSGERLEAYSRVGSVLDFSSAESTNHVYSVDLDADEPDELKATVVQETIMAAADVAHNLQSWQHMVKWSSRLYMELRKAYVTGRGMDPQTKWFENQIGFLESYLMPLAHRLEDIGVFGDDVGPAFAGIVESNRDKWLVDGFDESQKVIAKGAERYAEKEGK